MISQNRYWFHIAFTAIGIMGIAAFFEGAKFSAFLKICLFLGISVAPLMLALYLVYKLNRNKLISIVSMTLIPLLGTLIFPFADYLFNGIQNGWTQFDSKALLLMNVVFYFPNEFFLFWNTYKKNWNGIGTIRKWMLLGMIFTPFAILMGFLSAGFGHGDYILARALFPWTMILSILRGEISTLFIILAFLQYPLYSYLIATFRNRWILPVAHAMGVIISFVISTDAF